MNRITLALLAIVFIQVEGSGQRNFVTLAPELNKRGTTQVNGVSTYYYSLSTSSKVKGSPFLSDNFEEGRIITADDSISNILLRYNIYEGNVQFIYENDTLIVADTKKVNAIQIGARTFVTSYYMLVADKVEFGYLEQLNQGKYKLLKGYRKEIKNDSYVSNYMGGGGSKEDYFANQESLFIKKNNDAASLIYPNKISLKKVFPQYTGQMSSYIKEQKLRIGRTSDLIRLIEYLNTL